VAEREEPVRSVFGPRLPETHCPQCHAPVTGLSCLTEPGAEAEEGSAVVCIECASLLVYEGGRLRFMEQAEMDDSPEEFLRELVAVRMAVVEQIRKAAGKIGGRVDAMSGQYILRGHEAVPAELMPWAEWFETAREERRVASDELEGGVLVSTVFLGLDHSRWQGPPLLFETMVFTGPHDGWQDRYTTWDEAEAGHRRVVEALREGREP
jgi:hypothetical protein